MHEPLIPLEVHFPYPPADQLHLLLHQLLLRNFPHLLVPLLLDPVLNLQQSVLVDHLYVARLVAFLLPSNVHGPVAGHLGVIDGVLRLHALDLFVVFEVRLVLCGVAQDAEMRV